MERGLSSGQHAGLNTSIGSVAGKVDKSFKDRLVFKNTFGVRESSAKAGICLETFFFFQQVLS